MNLIQKAADGLKVLNIPEEHKVKLQAFMLRDILNLTPKEVSRITDNTVPKVNKLALEGSKLTLEKNEQAKEYKRIVRSYENLRKQIRASERLQHLTQVRNRAIKQL